MANNVRRTAMGQMVDIDRIRLANETAIAIGNTKTNARGDQLGPGGKVIKSRAQVQQDYYRMNTPMASDNPVTEAGTQSIVKQVMAQPQAIDSPVVEVETNKTNRPRGSFAEAIANDTEVKTELLDPTPVTGAGRSVGVQRI